MRLNSLLLQPYGSLLDTHIDLGEGLTVVHGLNEAGKSTVLEAYADLLCGIRRSTTMGFLTTRKKLRVHATITTDDGQLVKVIRTAKNPPNDLLDAQTSLPIDIGIREALTQGLGHDSLMARFGLDHDRLVVGGGKLMEGKGDLADIVFEARTGTDVRVLVDDLDTRCAELFTARANSASALNKAKIDREQLVDKIKATMSTAEAVETASVRRSEAEKELERCRSVAASRRTEHSRLVQLEGSWPYWLQYRSRKNELERIEANGPLLSADDLHAVTSASERLSQIDNDIKRETAAAETARREATGLVYDENLLAEQPAIDSLSKDKQAAESSRAKVTETDAQLVAERTDLAELLRRLDVHDIGDPVTALTAITVPDDRAADLDSLASERERIDGDIHKAQHAVREATAQLHDAQRPKAPDDNAADSEYEAKPASVSETRAHRDLMWHHVRANWLDGVAVPSEIGSGPSNLADRYETSVNDTDSAADDFALTAASDAKVGERRRALERAEASLNQAITALGDWEARWSTAATAARLPAGIGISGWRERAKRLAEAADIAESIRAADTLREINATTVAKWVAAAALLASEMDRSIAAERLPAWFDGIKAAYDESKSNHKAADVHRNNQIRATERAAELIAEKQGLEESLDAVAAKNGVNREVLAEIAERTKLHVEATAALREPEGQLRARHPGVGLDELAGEFTSRDPEQLGVEVATAKDELDSADEAVTAAQEDVIHQKRALDELTGRTGANDLQQELSQATAQVLELVEEYAITRIMHNLLTQELRTYFESHRNPVLERAGLYLGRLTNGRYTGLRSEGEGTERSLIVIGSDDNDYAPSALSEGTASQLYLALSLAGVLEVQSERQQAGQERVPIMLDDVLIAFDDERAASALDLLEEIGREQQVVLFTHHDSVRANAASRNGATALVSLAAPGTLQ
jgi:uncharacterized protein YhaN